MKKRIISVMAAVMAALTLTACSEVAEIKESISSSKETLSEVKKSVSNIKNGTSGTSNGKNEESVDNTVTDSDTDNTQESENADKLTETTDSTNLDQLLDNANNGKGEKGILSSPEDINLTDTGDGKNYTFTYGDEEFSAIYTEDNWKIIDSYKISNVDDNLIICQALIDEHPIHGSDLVSYRTAEDMAYEWLQHNIAYEILPDDNSMKSHAKDVDLDPQDQGKDFDEIYEDRTGKEFSLDNFGF